MKIKTTLAASALALAIGLAMPAAAQQTGTNTAGPTTGGSGNNSDATSTVNSLDLNVQDSGNTDNSVSDSGNLDLDVDDSGNTDNSINDSGNLDIADSGNTDNSTNDSGNDNDNSAVVALQVLTATISNAEELEFDGDDSDYGSGDNRVQGSAFAAYSGILNNGWNTGINSNAQAATNIAARGSVTFSQ